MAIETAIANLVSESRDQKIITSVAKAGSWGGETNNSSEARDRIAGNAGNAGSRPFLC
jgi:hypothetical protein